MGWDNIITNRVDIYNLFCNITLFCNNLLQNGLREHYYNSGRQLQPVL